MSPERLSLAPPTYFLQPYLERGALHELVDPKPEVIAEKIVTIAENTPEGTVQVVHASHMYPCKTTGAILAANELKNRGREVLAFQPKVGERNRDKLRVKYKNETLELNADLFTVEDNSLFEVLEIIQGKIKDGSLKTTDRKPVIVIDELMLFKKHENKSDEVIEILDYIKSLGFDIIVTGLTKDYRGLPFSPMKEIVDLLPEKEKDNWHGHMAKTRCYYCGDWANLTQRIIVDLDTGNLTLAPYSGKTHVVGDMEVRVGSKTSEIYRSICGHCGQDSCDRTC